MAPFAEVFFDLRFLTFTDFFAALRALGFDFLALLMSPPQGTCDGGNWPPGNVCALMRTLVIRKRRAAPARFFADERFFNFTDFFFFFFFFDSFLVDRFAARLAGFFAGFLRLLPPAFLARLAFADRADLVDFAIAAPSLSVRGPILAHRDRRALRDAHIAPTA